MPDMNMQTFEELQRHQLVTEFDIQSQTELTDYQVKLDNVDNPTQAQDNLIVGADGESLPHWNESTDFDTWIKINIATSGIRGFLFHGNSGLSSVSDIYATLEDGSDTFDDLNTFYWTIGNGAPSVSNGELALAVDEEIYNKGFVPNDIILDVRLKNSEPTALNFVMCSNVFGDIGYISILKTKELQKPGKP